MIKNKLNSQLVCLFIYIFTFWLSYILIPENLINSLNIWLLILIWHLYATLIIYIFSVILKNSSLYDPFWSVAPVPIVIFLSTRIDSLEVKLLILIPICFWALRLTRNWLISWKGFTHEDFRYIDLKNTNKINAEINNFFGIHLIPTLIVNFGLFPLYYFADTMINANLYLYLASLFTFLAVILETISDEQMRTFRNCFIQIKIMNRTSRTSKYTLFFSQYNSGFVMGFNQSGSNYTDHTLMPIFTKNNC